MQLDNLLRPPSPGTERRMREELYQERHITEQDVQHLKEWLSKQHHLPQIDDEQFLERFLYGCKYRLPRCKEVLDMYYTVRGVVPDFFSDRDPTSPQVRSVARSLLIIPLPQVSPAGYRVIMYRFCNNDASKLDAPSHFKRCFMMLDLQLQIESVLGFVLIMDLKNVTLLHLAKFTPPLLKKYLVCAQDAYPIRIKEIHFINAPTYVNSFLELIKSMLKEKLRKRVYVHSKGVEGLYDSVPLKMLPVDYGGPEKSSEEISDDFQKYLESYTEWFKKEETKTVDETKRIGKIVDSAQLFGIDGCFRKLAID